MRLSKIWGKWLRKASFSLYHDNHVIYLYLSLMTLEFPNFVQYQKNQAIWLRMNGLRGFKKVDTNSIRNEAIVWSWANWEKIIDFPFPCFHYHDKRVFMTFNKFWRIWLDSIPFMEALSSFKHVANQSEQWKFIAFLMIFQITSKCHHFHFQSTWEP